MFCQEHPERDQNPKFTPLSETTSIPTPFIYGVPPGQELNCDEHTATMEPWRGPTQNHTLFFRSALHLVCFDYQPIGHQKPMVNENQLDLQDQYLDTWKPRRGRPYKSDKDARRKIQITGKPFIYVGVAQASTDP